MRAQVLNFILFFSIFFESFFSLGWILESLFRFDFQFAQSLPVRLAGCCDNQNFTDQKFLSIRGNKYLSNIKSINNQCFIASVGHFFLKEKLKGSENELDSTSQPYQEFFQQLQLPIVDESCGFSTKNIKEFTTLNKNLDLCINIIGMIDEDLYTMEKSIGGKVCFTQFYTVEKILCSR